MNKILLTIIILFSSLLLYANEKKESTGNYVVSLNVEYSNKHPQFSTNNTTSICNTINLIYNDGLCQIMSCGGVYEGFTSDTCHIGNNVKTCNLSNLGTNIQITAPCCNEGNSGYINHPKQISIKPSFYSLGSSIVSGNYQNSSNFIFIHANYSLIIQPLLVDCQYIEEDEQNYSYILFNDPVCIKATTGFPKEVYKWRYSYKTSKGVTKSGTFEPYDSSDNGATIYVKASDFMSQETFDDLLESQNPITITPDGATGYNKPLSVKGINVTARLTAPKIKSIDYQKP